MPLKLKLGKKPFEDDKRDLLFANYFVSTTLPKIPTIFGHAGLFRNWGMLGNGPDNTVEPGFDGAGDCVFAGADHETMLWNKLGGKTVTFTGKEAISDYSAVTGYIIDDEMTDNGTSVRTALGYRRTKGVVDTKGNRHKIGAYIKLDPKNWNQLMTAAYIFGAVGIGFEFPDSAMSQFDKSQTWDVVPGAQIEGGHYVPVMGRPSKSTGSAVTWAKRQVFTRDFYEEYNDETWALLSLEELKSTGLNERGFNITQLKADLSAITKVQ